MSRLARRNRVLFLESLGLRQPRLAGRDLSRMARRARRAAAGPRAVDGLHVLSPLVVPLHGRRGIARGQRQLLRAQVGRAARSLGHGAPAAVELRPAGRVAPGGAGPGGDRLPLRRRHRGPEGRAVGCLPRRRGALRGPRRPRARLGARARRAHAHAQRAGPRTRPTSPTPSSSPPRSSDGPTDPALDALPHPRIVFTGRGRRHQARPRPARGRRPGAARLVDRPGRAGRRGRPAHGHLARSGGCPTSTCSARAPTRRCPTSCAAPTPR